MELGSGCGFLGIVAAPFVHHFFCIGSFTIIKQALLRVSHYLLLYINTPNYYDNVWEHYIDTGTEVLKLCRQNLVQNNATGNVSVHELNWFNSEKELHSLSSCSSSNCSGGDDDHERYKWRHNELELLKKASIILASDGKRLCPSLPSRLSLYL